MWQSGMRRGAVRSIDLVDYHSDEAYVELHHCPETDTPLKSGADSERPVALQKTSATSLHELTAETRTRKQSE